jgi:NAD(P)H-nitrite reductase large subunit
MASMGQTVSKSLCEHFAHSREELYNIVKIKGYKTFNEVLHNHGEVCTLVHTVSTTPARVLFVASLHDLKLCDAVLTGC